MENGLWRIILHKTRAKSSYGTSEKARRAKSQEIIWYELQQNSMNQ